MVVDKLKFIEELNNVKELTLASPYVNKHVVKYIDILIAIYDKEVKQYEDDMWEEYMSNSVNDNCERRFIRGRSRTWIDR